MSVGFFACASRNALSSERINSAFVGHTPWGGDGGNKEIELHGRNWHVVCLVDQSTESSTVWKDTERPDFQGSFVFLLGWCYRISSFYESLSVSDYCEMVARFRSDLPPLSDDFGGQFIALVFDAKRNRLAIQPDRLAMGTCFFSESSGEFAASNRALRLANYFGSALDGHSVVAQMRGTHIPFGRSLFAGVRRVMGSEYLEFDFGAGQARLKKTSSLYVPQREISYADSVDLVTDTVRTTVRRLLAAGPVRFDLTGGNDTRVIASAIENITRQRNGQKFGFRIADREGTPDVLVARRVAESCGWSLTRVDREPSAQASVEELARAATAGDGNFPCNYIWERVDSERAYARKAQWKTHVGAPSGELFRGFFYLHELLSFSRNGSDVNYDSLLAYRTYASRGVDLSVFGPGAVTFDANDDALLEPYRALGDAGGSLPKANKLDLMYLQRHCYRSGNTLSALFGFLDLRLPFLSWELAGLGLSLPWKYRATRGLMQRVIGKLSPKLANIPNEDGQPMKPLSLATLPAYVAAEIPMETLRAVRVLRRMLGRSAGEKKAGLPAPQPAYLEVVDTAKALPSLFSATAIKQLCAAVESPQRSRDSITTFYVLCSIELLLQQARCLRPGIVFN